MSRYQNVTTPSPDRPINYRQSVTRFVELYNLVSNVSLFPFLIIRQLVHTHIIYESFRKVCVYIYSIYYIFDIYDIYRKSGYRPVRMDVLTSSLRSLGNVVKNREKKKKTERCR